MANTRGYTREQMDDLPFVLYNVRKSITEGYFKDEIVPVTVSTVKVMLLLIKMNNHLNAKLIKFQT